MADPITDFLQERGFRKLKANTWGKIHGDMLFWLQRQGGKGIRDAGWWHLIYPMVFPRIWPSMGFAPAVARHPVLEGTIKLDPENPSRIESELLEELERSVLPWFESCEDLKTLAEWFGRSDSERSKYPEAFALMGAGQISMGREVLKTLLTDSKSARYRSEEQETVIYLASLDDEKLKVALANFRDDNISGLKLKKLLSPEALKAFKTPKTRDLSLANELPRVQAALL